MKTYYEATVHYNKSVPSDIKGTTTNKLEFYAKTLTELVVEVNLDKLEEDDNVIGVQFYKTEVKFRKVLEPWQVEVPEPKRVALTEQEFNQTLQNENLLSSNNTLQESN